MARGIHRGNGNGDVERVRCRFRIGEIGSRLINSNLIVLRIDLDQHRSLLDILVVVYVDLDHIA